MAKWALQGNLERAVMERLWSASEPQTVRQVQAGLPGRSLAYTTITTVLRRLTAKHLVVQYRSARAYRYAAARSRGDLVAELMLDALQAVDDSENRAAAIVHFVERVGTDEACALRRALAEMEHKRRSCAPVEASRAHWAAGG
ncbi:BlaI/MecI/CopY family transcriptional regulator [Mycobacterium sp. SM1]|uniref:BlaI/MecI/CopY family transcriptional regulator n=1 Tax=Mycobacterium sp. SM1 TaxID=2816243 RepID=UPI001BD0F895|nr:BlaI/MecI/CopY family transcriptional regulator [Mycobacterium sp. SM1]MBS4727613.1 BlaI/MecI/CopY family transcriptional regulator [Mycobacterium sp. SM1]